MAVNVSLICATIVAWRNRNETKDGFVLLFLHIFACACVYVYMRVGAREIIKAKNGVKMLTKIDTSGKWPAVKGKKRKLAEMLCDPDNNMTITELCNVVGVSRQTFYNWQHDANFNGYVEFLIDSFTDSELPAAWKSLIKKMKTGNVEALKLFFEMKGKYKSQVVADLNVRKLEDLI